MKDDCLNGTTPHWCGHWIGEHLLHEGRLICPGADTFDELEARAT